MDGLLGGAALAVDGGAGAGGGEDGREDDVAGEVARLRADLGDAAEDYVVDEGGVGGGD